MTWFTMAVAGPVYNEKFKMKKINLGSWNVWRATRLVLGGVFGIAGIIQADYVLAAAGVFLIVHAYINSCAACQTGTCETPKQTNYGKF